MTMSAVRAVTAVAQQTRPHQRHPVNQAAQAAPVGFLQRAMQRPASLTAQDVLALQGTIGNRAVARLLVTSNAGAQPVAVQREFPLGPVDDSHEREADRVADLTMRPPLRTALYPEVDPAPAPAIRRAGGSDGRAAAPALKSALDSQRGAGNPLALPVRSEMEARFGQDFGQVRIHTDRAAVRLSRALDAEAFTYGCDIYFDRGRFAATGTSGKRLLAHELTHVVQQGATGAGAVQAKRVQRYTKLTVADQQTSGDWQGLAADLRVSDDGRMAVKDTPTTPQGTNAYQELYATPTLINKIAWVLASINSAFTVQQGTQALTGHAPSGGLARTLYQVKMYQQDFEADNPTMSQYTFENCNSNMWNFQGIVRRNYTNRQSITRFERPVKGQRDVDLGLGNAVDLSLGRNEAAQYISGRGTYREAKAEYANVKDSRRDKRAKKIGANQYASPDIGEAYGIFRIGGGLGQMHFAPVIAKSGEDTVALENYAGNPGSVPSPILVGGGTRPPVNPNWYYRMSGPVKRNEDQSFWGEQRRLAADEFGNTPLVVTMGSR